MNPKTFYKNYHNYFITNRRNFQKDILSLDKKILNISQYSDKGYSFYYIKKNNELTNNIELIRHRDILNGIYLGNYDIGTEFFIYQEEYPTNILLKIKLTEKNHKNIFLPIKNKEFLNLFLLSRRFYIKSNVILTEPLIFIYSNIRLSFQYQLLSSKYFIHKLERSSYFIYEGCSENTIFTNEKSNFYFRFNVDEYYGKKILNFYRKYKLKKECLYILTKRFNIYNDIANEIIKYL